MYLKTKRIKHSYEDNTSRNEAKNRQGETMKNNKILVNGLQEFFLGNFIFLQEKYMQIYKIL